MLGQNIYEDLPTYKEIENIYSKSSNAPRHRHNFNDLVSELPLLISIEPYDSETHALNNIYTKKDKQRDVDYWKKIKIGIEIKNVNSSPLHQGNILNGRIIISNQSAIAFPYLLCSVALVGRISTVHKYFEAPIKRKHVALHNFLSLLDHKATLTLSNIGDNEFLSHGNFNNDKRYFMPFTNYGGSFQFKIPQKLLSSTCNTYELLDHCNILPSIDLKDSMGLYLRLLRKGFNKSGRNLDISIEYNIEVSVVGKLSDYKDSVSKDRNILVTKELKAINILPSTNIILSNFMSIEKKNTYLNLIDNAKKIISENEINNKPRRLESDQETKVGSMMEKVYLNSNNNNDCSNIDQKYYSYTKPLVNWYTKYKGEIGIKIPRQLNFYDISSRCFYVIADKTITCSRLLKILFLFERINTSLDFKCLSINNVRSEIISIKYLSKYAKIPIEIDHDLILGNQIISDNNHFNPIEEKIKNPVWQLLNKIKSLRLKSNEYPIVGDLWSLANLDYDYERFKICLWNSDELNLNVDEESSSENIKACLEISIDGNTLNTLNSTSQNSKLEQDFQTCYVGKISYLKITMTLHHRRRIILRLPISIKSDISIL